MWYSENQRGKAQYPDLIVKLKGTDVKPNTENRPDAHCINCGCNVATKTRCLSCQGPIAKWMPVVTDDEKYEIEKIINEG